MQRPTVRQTHSACFAPIAQRSEGRAPCSHFRDGKAKSQEGGDLSRASWLVEGRARTRPGQSALPLCVGSRPQSHPTYLGTS